MLRRAGTDSLQWLLLAESGSSNRWRFSGTKDRFTAEAAVQISDFENAC
jgi:hypothetical protein